MGTVLSLDPGFGNTKVCLDGTLSVIPSIVVRPKSIGLAGLGMKGTAHTMEVAFEGHRFAVGPGAVEWGTPQNNLDYSALASPQRTALFYAALARLLTTGTTPIDLLLVGLPVPLLQDERQAELVLSELKGYKGRHDFVVANTPFRMEIDKLKVVPQPLGAYADWLLGDDLQARGNASQAEIAVLDIGMNTVDLYAIKGGRVEPRFMGGGKGGVRRLLEQLEGEDREIEELDLAFRQGRLPIPPALVHSWLSELMATVEKSMPKLARFSAVIPVGGGALFLGDQLRLHLASRGAAIHWPQDPVGSNARGLWKWGAYGAHR